jgi:hypothetical protein
MRAILDLPEHDLAICLGHLQALPRDQHRQFVDVVSHNIDAETFIPGELTGEVIGACHLARYLLRELREARHA